jgi:hypothetical protein
MDVYGLEENQGIQKAKAAELIRIQRLSLVAGVGFEPTTFRL